MTCVLNVFFVVAALIAAAKRGCTEGAERTANGYLTFWSTKCNLLRLRSTDGNFGSNICTWYRPENYDDIGVNVTHWAYLISTKRTVNYWRPQYWKFGANNSMWRVDEDGNIFRTFIERRCRKLICEWFLYGALFSSFIATCGDMAAILGSAK